MPDNLIKPQVFVSYSREPRENFEFVRWLAGRLRDAGFDVPLDENDAAADDSGQAVQAGIRDARHALFVITRGWLERPRSRIELDLFAGRPPETHRRVAVRRESIDLRALGSRCQNLQVIPWLPDEPEPEARFWEVYCVLSRTPPGAGEQWAEKGSDLAARPACRSRPVLVRSARDWTFLLTDAGPCYRLDRGDRLELEPLPDLDGCSAAVVDAEGTLVVGLYDAMVATLRGEEWEYRATDAPVLSLAATPQGVVVGDSAGTVTFCGPGGAALGAVTLGEPIVDLPRSTTASWPLARSAGSGGLEGSGNNSPRPIATPPRSSRPGRLVGLFETGNPGQRPGAFGARAWVVLIDGRGRADHRSARGCSRKGSAAVVAFGRGTRRAGQEAPPRNPHRHGPALARLGRLEDHLPGRPARRPDGGGRGCAGRPRWRLPRAGRPAASLRGRLAATGSADTPGRPATPCSPTTTPTSPAGSRSSTGSPTGASRFVGSGSNLRGDPAVQDVDPSARRRRPGHAAVAARGERASCAGDDAGRMSSPTPRASPPSSPAISPPDWRRIDRARQAEPLQPDSTPFAWPCCCSGSASRNVRRRSPSHSRSSFPGRRLPLSAALPGHPPTAGGIQAGGERGRRGDRGPPGLPLQPRFLQADAQLQLTSSRELEKLLAGGSPQRPTTMPRPGPI